MDEEAATAVAKGLGGLPWQSGGGVWLVLFERADGKVVVLSDEAVAQYPDWDGFERNEQEVAVVFAGTRICGDAS